MIANFDSKTAEDIFDGVLSRHAKKIPYELHDKVRRLFDQINAASQVSDLRSPPGNRLELLKGNLAAKWSIRVNNQWRIIFNWTDGQTFNVDVVDYH